MLLCPLGVKIHPLTPEVMPIDAANERAELVHFRLRIAVGLQVIPDDVCWIASIPDLEQEPPLLHGDTRHIDHLDGKAFFASAEVVTCGNDDPA